MNNWADDWDEFDPWNMPKELSTTHVINNADLTPAERKGFFRTLDDIRNLPEV